MSRKILKSTERGQITLPKQWREQFQTDSYIVQLHEDRLVVLPLNLPMMEEEEILFDADRDNHGKGVSPEEMITMLKKIRHG